MSWPVRSTSRGCESIGWRGCWTSPERASRAFTLLEVLLATSLTAVIAVAVAGVLGSLFTAQERVRARGERRALLAALERRIVADLRALVPPGGLYAAGLVGEDLDAGDSSGGEPLVEPEVVSAAQAALREAGSADDLPPLDARDRLTLAVLPPAAAFGRELPAGEGALWDVTYEVDDDPATPERGLVRQVTRLRDPATGSEPEPAEVLSEAVVGLELSYFDATIGEWLPTWDSSASDTLPQAVRVELAVVERGALLTYRLVVASPTARPTQLMEPTP